MPATQKDFQRIGEIGLTAAGELILNICQSIRGYAEAAEISIDEAVGVLEHFAETGMIG